MDFTDVVKTLIADGDAEIVAGVEFAKLTPQGVEKGKHALLLGAYNVANVIVGELSKLMDEVRLSYAKLDENQPFPVQGDAMPLAPPRPDVAARKRDPAYL